MSANGAPSATGVGGSRKSIDRLITLPFSKSLEISFKSLRVRFFRSMITVSSLVLAVSFLSFVLVNLDVAAGLLREHGQEAARILSKAGYDVDLARGAVAMSAKERWIVMLSLLVCTVGIVNAQLMSVTERFAEIGVMKCLGALDSMILKLFLLEAAMQGLLGAAIGALAGCLFSLLAGTVSFGLGALSGLSLADAAISVGLATLAGCFLSLVGVLYPALLAARMEPIKAIRAEH
ncbi:FtsX-like permease family protein [Pseudodesulfovibrio cashew]|uniref:FtsX-like permease family protein n=1 Tax=Pseudodesulfovibrio cashew TaxID=2678688 RepID=A0A6I6JW68_9BACT|nr:FtsX-like permease family protein [Pseudodesulfovibrio cashew]QGY41984.1 FtsX-like permease family protein [Pseudodesulfovibrio cashew]